MNENVHQPEQDDTQVSLPFPSTYGLMSNQDTPAGADVPNEFAAYGYEETPVPYLPLPSESPQQFAGQARPAPIADVPEHQKQEGNQGKGAQDKNKTRRSAEDIPLGLTMPILILALAGIVFGMVLMRDTQLLRSGVEVQGIIVDKQSDSCGRGGRGQVFSVQFTDRTGQTYTSTFDGCTYSGFDASIEDPVTIVYLPDNPTLIAPRDELPIRYQWDLILTVLSFTLLIVFGLLLSLRLRRLIRKQRRASDTYPSTDDE